MFHCYFRWSVHGVKPIRVRSGQNKDQAAPQAVGLHDASGQNKDQAAPQAVGPHVASGQNKDQAAPQAVGLHVASGQENVQDSVKHFSCHLSDEFVSYPNSSCMISYDDLSRKIGHIVIFFALMNI